MNKFKLKMTITMDKRRVWSLCALFVLLLWGGDCVRALSDDQPIEEFLELPSFEMRSKAVAAKSLTGAKETVNLWEKVLQDSLGFSAKVAGMNSAFSEAVRSVKSAVEVIDKRNEPLTENATVNAVRLVGTKANSAAVALKAIDQSLAITLEEFSESIKNKIEEVMSKAGGAATLEWGRNVSFSKNILKEIMTPAEVAKRLCVEVMDVLEVQHFAVSKAKISVIKAGRQMLAAIKLLKRHSNNNNAEKMILELTYAAHKRLNASLDILRELQGTLAQMQNYIFYALHMYDDILPELRRLLMVQYLMKIY